jgi:hypothetical protein
MVVSITVFAIIMPTYARAITNNDNDVLAFALIMIFITTPY